MMARNRKENVQGLKIEISSFGRVHEEEKTHGLLPSLVTVGKVRSNQSVRSLL